MALIILDLDNTIYSSEKFKLMKRFFVREKVAKEKEVRLKKAEGLIKGIKNKLKRKERPSSTIHGYIGLDLTKDDFIETLSQIDPREYIEFDKKIYGTIENLSQDNILVLVSNSPRKQVEKILEILKIKKFFRDIYSLQEQNVAKPEGKLFARILRKLRYASSHAVSVGNNYENELKPANQLGMRTVLIADKENEDVDHTIKDIHKLPKVLRTLFSS